LANTDGSKDVRVVPSKKAPLNANNNLIDRCSFGRQKNMTKLPTSTANIGRK